jgi:hypothetical protein
MITILSKLKAKTISESDVKKIVLEWYTNGMFADILQDEWKRSRRDITRRTKNS